MRKPSTQLQPKAPSRARSGYVPPLGIQQLSLQTVLGKAGRTRLEAKQLEFFGRSRAGASDVVLYAAGNADLLFRPAVSIVGTRDVSDDGRARARRLAKELSAAGIVVMSGLATGVDAAAHDSAIRSGGSTVAVIGTPISKAYPAENADLQMLIYRDHLLVSPFAEGETVFKSNFPQRNRVMAALSDATVIIEASDTSGTLHQAAECQRLGRWLFIAQAVANDPALSWPAQFLGQPKTAVLRETADILAAIRRGDD